MDSSLINLESRLRCAIDARIRVRGKFGMLHDLTGISAEGWKSFYYGRQRPNPDMIESLSKAWPDLAFWIVTGWCDTEHGHLAPEGIESVEIKRHSVLTATE